MTRASRSIAIPFALALTLPTFASRPRTASGQTPDGPPGSAWRVVREGASRLVALSPDGTRLAYVEERPVPSPDGTPEPWIQDLSVVVVDTGRGDVLFRSETSRIRISAVAINADASKLAVVRMKDGPNVFYYGEPIQPDPRPKPPAADGGSGIGGGGSTLTIEERVRQSLALGPFWRGMPTEGRIRSSALGSSVPPRPHLPITGGHYIPPTSSVEVWDVPDKARVKTSADVCRPLIAAAFGPGAAELRAIGLDLRRVEIDATPGGRAEPGFEAGKPVKFHASGLFDVGPVAMTSFSADGRRAATLRAATYDDRISIAIWKDGDESPTFPDRPASVAPQWVISVAPDGRRFVTAGIGNRVHVWDFERRSIERTIVNGPENVPHVAFARFARDSSRIVTADAVGTVRVWDGDSGRSLFTLKEPVADVRDAALVDDRLTIVRGGVFRDVLATCAPLAARTFAVTKEAQAPR